MSNRLTMTFAGEKREWRDVDSSQAEIIFDECMEFAHGHPGVEVYWFGRGGLVMGYAISNRWGVEGWQTFLDDQATTPQSHNATQRSE